MFYIEKIAQFFAYTIFYAVTKNIWCMCSAYFMCFIPHGTHTHFLHVSSDSYILAAFFMFFNFLIFSCDS